jgi:photosystem II stability/assembly factor-like uncharacterized protein
MFPRIILACLIALMTLQLRPLHAAVAWETLGTGGGGLLTDIAVDPTNPDVVYVALDVGGIRKSVDGGNSWAAINRGLREVSDNMGIIAMSPHNSQVVFATARGAGRGSDAAGHIFKSTDAGATWVLKWTRSKPISALAFDPHRPEIIYAGSGDRRRFIGRAGQLVYRPGNGEFYKSIDGGEHWQLLSVIHDRAHILSIAVDPHNPQIIFATTEFGLYKSTDGGASWAAKTQGLPHANTRQVLIDRKDSRLLYLTLDPFPNPTRPLATAWQGGVYKSVDGGESWTSKNNGLPQHLTLKPTFRQTSSYWHIAMHPEDGEVLYVCEHSAHGGIYRTKNGAEIWSPIIVKTQDIPAGWQRDLTRFRAANIAIARTKPDRLFFSTLHSGQIFRSDNGGADWQQVYTQELAPGKWKSRGLELMGGTAIAVHPTDPRKLYFGYGDWGVFTSDDGGMSFTYVLKTEDVNMIAIDPSTPNVLYVATGFSHTSKGPMPGRLYKSVDGGLTWTLIGGSRRAINSLPPGFLFSLVIDPTSPTTGRTLYLADYGHGLYKSADGGAHWNRLHVGIDGREVRSLALDGRDPRVVYAGIDREGIFKSNDAGTSWQKLRWKMTEYQIPAIAVAPQDSQTLFAGVVGGKGRHGGVYKSVDGGMTWALKLADPGITHIAISAKNSGTLYAASFGTGLHRSLDGGETWEAFADGLPSVYVNTVTTDVLGQVYVGTKGNGVLRHPIETHRRP